jgi:hypothetical protein
MGVNGAIHPIGWFARVPVRSSSGTATETRRRCRRRRGGDLQPALDVGAQPPPSTSSTVSREVPARTQR